MSRKTNHSRSSVKTANTSLTVKQIRGTKVVFLSQAGRIQYFKNVFFILAYEKWSSLKVSDLCF